MRQFNFKVFEESDPDIIVWLNSIPYKERSTEIRRALRDFIRKPDFVVRQRKNSKAVGE
jgi:hypothetical protein